MSLECNFGIAFEEHEKYIEAFILDIMFHMYI